MDRFFEYFRKRLHLSGAAETYLRQHARVMFYDRLNHFLTPEVRAPYWCVVLQGLAYGYTLGEDGQRYIRWFAAEMQGFAGVRHLYTPSPSEHYIQFIEVSTVLCIPASRMRDGQKQFAELSEYLHVMKQQYIDRQDKLVKVSQEPTTYGRFAAFMKHFPNLARRTMPEQQMDFINVGHSQFFEARKRWLRDGRK